MGSVPAHVPGDRPGQPAAGPDADPTRQTWDTAELIRDYEVIGFAAPFVVVHRRSDGVRGSLEFTTSPRRYFGWKEHADE